MPRLKATRYCRTVVKVEEGGVWVRSKSGAPLLFCPNAQYPQGTRVELTICATSEGMRGVNVWAESDNPFPGHASFLPIDDAYVDGPLDKASYWAGARSVMGSMTRWLTGGVR